MIMVNDSDTQVSIPSQQFAMVPEFIICGASPTQVRVYACLALFVDWETGVCWPSHQTLAERLGVSVATVRRALRGLVSMGAVKVTRRFSDTGDQTSNLYSLPFVINRGWSNMTRGVVKSDQEVWSKMTTKQEPRTREGLTPFKISTDDCSHLPVDDDGYCTACGSDVA